MSVNEKMTAIADAIRDKTGGTDQLGLDDMVTGVGQVYDSGKQAEYDRFWDAYQNNGNRSRYANAFNFAGWDADTYKPKYPIIATLYGLLSAFSNSFVVDTIVPLTVRTTGSIQAAFNGCERLVRIPSLILEVPVTTVANAFNKCTNLEEINIECVGEGCFAGSGLNLQWSTKLNKASITSIINALSDTTSGLSITLSQTAIDNAFGDGSEFSGTDGPEWNELIETKSNWTISLV